MTGPDDGDGDADGVSRRWLIRLLVGLGLGVPIAVEATTLASMVSSRLFGGDGDSNGTTTGTETTTRPATGIGDELLPGTEPADVLADAVVSVGDDAWQFAATARVENTADAPYTLEFGAVTTASGTTVGGAASSGRVPPGESATVDGEWLLPAGETPAALELAGVLHRESGDVTTERTVRLGDVPVRG